MHINVTRYGAYVVVDIKANAFVHHMVRNIVGSLMEVGAGNQPESWMAELLAAKDDQDARCGNGKSGRVVSGVGGLPGPL